MGVCLSVWGDNRETQPPDSSALGCSRGRPRVLGVTTAIVVAVSLFVVGLAIGRYALRPSAGALPCPKRWIWYEGKCYFFSDAEGDWVFAKNSCSAMGAVLAVIQSQVELAFVQRYKGVSDHWIGLSRKEPNRPWEWVDGSEYNSSVFPVGGGERFAFLNTQKATSARSDNERFWVCTKQAWT